MAKHDPETENHIAELIRAAEAGNAAAQCNLAWRRRRGSQSLKSLLLVHQSCRPRIPRSPESFENVGGN